MDTLDTYAAKLRSGFYDYHWIEHPIDHAWVGDECVLVWARMMATLLAGEHTKTIDNRTLSVWVQSAGC
ncbi:hypothetical protein ASE12_14380 [Aeromicrobium sp. Root236]|nr:hypothetical protein ASE12_14380 [Aeromicrobium sp. Root236]